MTVRTFVIFEGQTSKSGFALRARGKNLDRVDKALKSYHAQVAAANAQRKTALLSEIVSACERWLKDKAVTSGLGSQLFQNRRLAIRNLGQEALQELLGVDPGLLAAVSFSQHKIAALGSADKPQTKALAAGYAHERTHYLELGKKRSPISGTAVVETHKNLHILTSPQDPLIQKRFDELTYAEFRKIAAQGVRNVDFMNKEERQDVIAIPRGGYFFDARSARIDATDAGSHPYVIDAYGSLFTKMDRGSTKRGATQFNHSSFNAGKAVVCAGECKIVNGRLVWIDNNSGHYKPDKQNLHNALGLLARDGVDLSRTAVVDYDFSSGQQQVSLFKGSSLLNDICYPGALHLATQASIDDALARLSAGTFWR